MPHASPPVFTDSVPPPAVERASHANEQEEEARRCPLAAAVSIVETPGPEDRKMDQVRDILCGGLIRDCDRRFQELETRLRAERRERVVPGRKHGWLSSHQLFRRRPHGFIGDASNGLPAHTSIFPRLWISQGEDEQPIPTRSSPWWPRRGRMAFSFLSCRN